MSVAEFEYERKPDRNVHTLGFHQVLVRCTTCGWTLGWGRESSSILRDAVTNHRLDHLEGRINRLQELAVRLERGAS